MKLKPRPFPRFVSFLFFQFFPADPPLVKLKIGPNIALDQIKEGDDIYFECDVKSNPPYLKLEWKHNVSSFAK